MRYEHRATVETVDSLAEGSVQKGCRNTEKVQRPDIIVEGLISAGILPKEALVGREKFAGIPYLERTCVNVPLGFLEKHKETILAWVEDNTEVFCEDAYGALRVGSIIAASVGLYTPASPLLTSLLGRLNTLPDTTSKLKVLRNPERLLALASAF